MKKQWSTVFLLLLTLMVVIFSVLNVDPVGINFGFSIVEIPLAIVLIGTLLIGVIMAVLLSTGIILRYKREQKKLRNQLTTIETEKENLMQNYEKDIKSLVAENKELKKEFNDLKRVNTTEKTSQSVQSNTQTDIEE